MRNPAEQILEKASQDLSEKKLQRDLRQEKLRAIKGVMEDANQAHRELRKEIKITDYASADNETLSVVVTPGEEIDIKGKLQRADGQAVSFPMYKVIREEVKSDTMETPLRYQVLVADPENPNGYRALALLAGRPNEYRDGRKGDFQLPLNEEQRAMMIANGGWYIDSHGSSMLEEVHNILDMAIAQQTEAENAA